MAEFCCCSWRGKAAHLFRTERDPYPLLQALQAVLIRPGLSVVTTAQTDKAGTDQVNGWLSEHDREAVLCRLLLRILEELSVKKTYKTSLSSVQQKKIIRISLLLVILLLLAVFFTPGKGLFFLRKQKEQVAVLRAENQELVEKNNALREEIKRVKTDKSYLEEVARSQHGLLKKDEVVFDFSPKEKRKRE